MFPEQHPKWYSRYPITSSKGTHDVYNVDVRTHMSDTTRSSCRSLCNLYCLCFQTPLSFQSVRLILQFWRAKTGFLPKLWACLKTNGVWYHFRLERLKKYKSNELYQLMKSIYLSSFSWVWHLEYMFEYDVPPSYYTTPPLDAQTTQIFRFASPFSIRRSRRDGPTERCLVYMII